MTDPNAMLSVAGFLDRLRGTPREWSLTRGGAIRLPDDGLGRCPIEAVAGCAGDYLKLAPKLRLTMIDATSIAAAADNNPHADSQMRSHLLEACGLEGR